MSSPITFVPTLCDLFPNASEKVSVEGLFTLDAGSDGIDPVSEPVASSTARACRVSVTTTPSPATPWRRVFRVTGAKAGGRPVVSSVDLAKSIGFPSGVTTKSFPVRR